MKLSDRLFAGGRVRAGHRVPDGRRASKARVRTIVTATHTRDELQFALDAFAQVGRELGIICMSTSRRLSGLRCRPTYTTDLKAEDLQRLFTRDTREAYEFFARHIDPEASSKACRGTGARSVQLRLFFTAFTMKLSPARRVVYAASLHLRRRRLLQRCCAGIGAGQARARHACGVPGVTLPDGHAGRSFIAFALVNLLVLLEVADRLSLKNDLEIAREIQKAMLPPRPFHARPASTSPA